MNVEKKKKKKIAFSPNRYYNTILLKLFSLDYGIQSLNSITKVVRRIAIVSLFNLKIIHRRQILLNTHLNMSVEDSMDGGEGLRSHRPPSVFGLFYFFFNRYSPELICI